MSELIRAGHHDGGLDLVLDAGALGSMVLARPEVRAALLSAIRSIGAEIRFVLIRAALPSGFAGPDLPMAEDEIGPTVGDLCQAIEAAPVPVAVLLEGPASGRGAELFLAAHLRLSTPAARVGFPDVLLGRLPDGGAIQRLARSIGAEQALRLMQGGRVVAAAEALALGLFDRVIEADDEASRLDQARHALASLSVPRPALGRSDGVRDGKAYLRALAAARTEISAKTHPLPAETALIDCLEAVLLLPAPQALSFAMTQAEEVQQSDEAAALTHLRRAEVKAAQVPAPLARFEATAVRRLGVSGAETGFAGLVLTALSRGLTVFLADPSRDRLAQFLEKIASRQEVAVQAGQLTPAQRDADWARLIPVAAAGAITGADLILAGPEAALPELAKSVPVLVIGRGALPGGAFRLVLTGRMAELALPAASPGPVALTGWTFLRRMGFQVVLTGQQAMSGIAGRLSLAGAGALRAMQDMGVSAEALRQALAGFGQTVSGMSDPEGTDRTPPREMDAEEIVQRWLAALGNEGARLMQAGVTSAPGDIDLVAVTALGFPRYRGGPMHQADRRGAMILRRDLSDWQSDAPVWVPVAALDALVSLGRGFAGAVRPE